MQMQIKAVNEGVCVVSYASVVCALVHLLSASISVLAHTVAAYI
jgi:hypothetical protein